VGLPPKRPCQEILALLDGQWDNVLGFQLYLASMPGMASDRPVPPPNYRVAQAAQTVRHQHLGSRPPKFGGESPTSPIAECREDKVIRLRRQAFNAYSDISTISSHLAFAFVSDPLVGNPLINNSLIDDLAIFLRMPVNFL
jgi:hypothetical protein